MAVLRRRLLLFVRLGLLKILSDGNRKRSRSNKNQIPVASLIQIKESKFFIFRKNAKIDGAGEELFGPIIQH